MTGSTEGLRFLVCFRKYRTSEESKKENRPGSGRAKQGHDTIPWCQQGQTVCRRARGRSRETHEEDKCPMTGGERQLEVYAVYKALLLET